MMRGFWFAAGAASGIYVLTKARRTAESFTPDGLRDRLAGLSLGAQLFGEEVRAGMNERETELRTQLRLETGRSPRSIEAAPAEQTAEAAETAARAETVGSS